MVAPAPGRSPGDFLLTPVHRVERAVDAALAAGEVTADLGGTLSTVQATDAVLRHLTVSA